MTTRTTTKTHTRTVTRTALVRLQLEVTVRRLIADSDRIIEKMIRTGLAEGFLSRLDFYALNAAGACIAKLSLGVNWDEHRGLVATSASVRVPAGWVDNVAPEVHVAVELFGEVVEATGAHVKVHMVPPEDADRAELARRLGLHVARRPTWAAAPKTGPLPIPELPELQVEFSTVAAEAEG